MITILKAFYKISPIQKYFSPLFLFVREFKLKPDSFFLTFYLMYVFLHFLFNVWLGDLPELEIFGFTQELIHEYSLVNHVTDSKTKAEIRNWFSNFSNYSLSLDQCEHIKITSTYVSVVLQNCQCCIARQNIKYEGVAALHMWLESFRILLNIARSDRNVLSWSRSIVITLLLGLMSVEHCGSLLFMSCVCSLSLSSINRG